MNPSSHQEVEETVFDGPPLHQQKRIIYFSSGETLDLEDPDEEEAERQSSNRTPFEEPGGRTGRSLKNVAILVGRMSLLACDFLGERLAGALGLNAAKYQYAIDQHHREHKAAGDHMEDQAESLHLSPGLNGSRYGATGDAGSPSDPHGSCNVKRGDDEKGCQNRAYQGDEDD